MEQAHHITGLKSGSHLGPYTILKRLGEGGMSVVYLAEHSTLGRLVAIKVLRPEFAGQEESVQRFFLEARAVNQIRHPHIVDITDYQANEGGEAYYVMEFMEGLDVEALLDKRQITLLRALEIACQAASALDAIHEAGIVHRDFKSGNVFVTTDTDNNDWVKLIDFGLAKLNDPHSRRIGDTLEGRAAGTPEFISPEQAMAKEVDNRSDIYSFGVFLYQMVTGLLPFRGTLNEVLRAHVNEKPKRPRRIKGVPHTIPRELDEVIMRCLAKKPDARPQSMKDLQAALAMIRDGVRYELTLRERRMWRVGFAAAAIVALFVGSASSDLVHGRRAGTSLVKIAGHASDAFARMSGNEVAVANAALIPVPTPATAVVAEPASAPASAPAAAPSIVEAQPPPTQEVAKASAPELQRKKKKLRR